MISRNEAVSVDIKKNVYLKIPELNVPDERERESEGNKTNRVQQDLQLLFIRNCTDRVCDEKKQVIQGTKRSKNKMKWKQGATWQTKKESNEKRKTKAAWVFLYIFLLCIWITRASNFQFASIFGRIDRCLLFDFLILVTCGGRHHYCSHHRRWTGASCFIHGTVSHWHHTLPDISFGPN